MRDSEEKRFQVVAHVVMLLVTLCVLFPFLLLFISSISDEASLFVNGYSLFPEKFSLDSYRYILQSGGKILSAYGMTIAVTAIGTIVHIALASLMAFPLSVKNLPFRRGITFFVFFTMLFNGGIVPSYVLWSSYLGISDTFFAQLLPNLLLNAMNVLLIRTYFANSIPDSLIEAARIDGASYYRVFGTIIIPLGKPILVTIGTFAGLNYWNDWTNGLYYITRKTEFYTIQNLLNKMVTDIQYLATSTNITDSTNAFAQLPTAGIQMAVAFVAIVPIMILFPFLQKYYSKGIMVGAVKG